MKSIIASALLCLTFSAISATEFLAKSGNEECTIVKDKVTKKVTFQKGAAGFTTTSTIQSFGTEALVEKAIETSSGRTLAHLGVEFYVVVDGKKTSLHADDSRESMTLIQLVNSACF